MGIVSVPTATLEKPMQLVALRERTILGAPVQLVTQATAAKVWVVRSHALHRAVDDEFPNSTIRVVRCSGHWRWALA